VSKYILFSYAAYYPYGGMGDCDGVFDTLQEALAFDRYGTDFEVLQVPELIVHENRPGRRGRKTPLAEYIRTKRDAD